MRVRRLLDGFIGFVALVLRALVSSVGLALMPGLFASDLEERQSG